MPIDEHMLQACVQRAVTELSAGYGGVMVSLGAKLGLYKAMAGGGPLTAAEVAKRADCAERYVREWLNSQAAGGYVRYHAVSDSYELPAEHALVLADETSPVYFPPAWEVPASMWLDEDKAIEIFRTGRGLSWRDHHERLFHGVAAFYRNAYRGSLVQEWLPSLTGVVDKLKAGAKVADVGCGHGHSTLLMARTFPQSRFWGFDSHEESIQAARVLAGAEGLQTSVSFESATAQTYPAVGFDLICFFDCLHDMGDPIGAARHAAEALAPDGTILLVEPFAHDRLEDNLTPVGRLYYAASTTICCAHALSEEGGEALGAQAGETRLARVFAAAGLRTCRRAAATPFNLILEITR